MPLTAVGFSTMVLLSAFLQPGAPRPLRPPASQERAILSSLDLFGQTAGFSGTVLVAQYGRPIVVRGVGFADPLRGVPNSARTQFRIGSLTKPFTAIGVLQLAQAGKLKLDDPVRDYVTEIPESWGGVTIHHLLSHTGGIPSHSRTPEYSQRMSEPTTPLGVLRLVADRPLDFPPGEEFRYSNTGYILLGLVIERASGRSYCEFLKANITQPLRMTKTGCDREGLTLKDRALGFILPRPNQRPRGNQSPPPLHMSWPFSAGVLYSTAEDLLRFDEGLYADDLLSEEWRETMFTPVEGRYAYGWSVEEHFGRRTMAHGGSIPGYRSHLIRVPEEHLLVVVLSNVAPTQVRDLALELVRVTLGEEPEPPPEDGRKWNFDEFH